MKYDLAIIGGGPGGYEAAAKAGAAGLNVIIFEKAQLGGTCLNRGCIPTKALLHSAEAYGHMAKAAELGIRVDGLSYDFSAMHQRKADIVEGLRQGIAKLMKMSKVTIVEGAAQVSGTQQITCNGEIYEAQDIIIASGSIPFVPPIPGHELEGVYTSNELLENGGKELDSLIVIGGGVIGVECASIYLPLGCRVTILELADHILPPMDKEIAQRLTMLLKKQDANIQTKVNVTSIAGEPGKMMVTYVDKKGVETTVEGAGVLVATGRRANTEGLFAEGCSPEMECGAIVGDHLGRTSIPHIYVIGDAKARNIQLAHVASAQGKNVVDAILGKEPAIDVAIVPSCVYTNPEIASVGISEEQAKATGIAVKCGKALTGANGKCLIEGSESGYLKLVCAAESDVLLGAQLVCPRATDMLAELTLAVQQKLTAAQLGAVIHPHPTICEMAAAACEQILAK